MPSSSVHRALMVACAAGSLLLAGCQFQHQADAKFGDQNFKTAVALIELYHLRHGQYPETLTDLDYTGDWDLIALNAVRYERLPDGYALDLTRGWVGQPTLTYPEAFWHGLGLRRSNVGHTPPANERGAEADGASLLKAAPAALHYEKALQLSRGVRRQEAIKPGSISRRHL